MKYKNVHLRFRREEGPNTYTYTILEPEAGPQETWKGIIEREELGSPRTEREEILLEPEAGQQEARAGRHAWKEKGGAREWAVAGDGGSRLALTETKDGEFQWAAGFE